MTHEKENLEPPTPNEEYAWDREEFWAAALHLSALSGYFTFIGFFAGPALVWAIQRDQFPKLRSHMYEALNFQLTYLIAVLGLLLLTLMTFGLGAMISIPLFGVLILANVLVPVIAAIKAWDGKPFRYPLTLRLIKDDDAPQPIDR